MEKTFAIVKSGVVENVIVAESLDVAITVTGEECVEYSFAIPCGIGWTYDGTAFTPPKPYPSWVLDAANHQWLPPIPYPAADGKTYLWDEPSKNWKAMP